MKEKTVRNIISIFPEKVGKRLNRMYDRYVFNEDIVNRYDQLFRSVQELIFAERYHDLIKGFDWIPDNFSVAPGKGAVGYQFLYVLARILDEVEPHNILELGMGQSTRLLGQYINIRYEQGDYSHTTVEHDEKWIEICRRKFNYKFSRVLKCDLGMKRSSGQKPEEKEHCFYKDFKNKLQGKKFDLIIIDGPFGGGGVSFARTDILEILPDCLKEDFCIIVDDYQRTGEQNMCVMLEKKLEEADIKFKKRRLFAEKDVYIAMSESLSYVMYY